MAGTLRIEEPKKKGQAETYGYLVIKNPLSEINAPQLIAKVPVPGSRSSAVHSVTKVRSLMMRATFYLAEKDEKGVFTFGKQLSAIQQEHLRGFFKSEFDPRTATPATISEYIQKWLPSTFNVSSSIKYGGEEIKLVNLTDLTPTRKRQPKETM